MQSYKQKHRKQLNSDQLDLLRLLSRFRFASSDLIAKYFNKPSGMYANKRLTILKDQDYIIRRYEPSYKLAGRPAAYYLSPKGAHILNELDLVNISLKSIYRSDALSDNFVDHCLSLLNIYLSLNALYKDQLSFLTKAEISKLDYFPKQLPDAYFKLSKKNHAKHYFLEIVDEATPLFILKRRIKQYIYYKDVRDWEEIDKIFPSIIFYCKSVTTSKKLEAKISSLLEAEGVDSMNIICSSADDLSIGAV